MLKKIFIGFFVILLLLVGAVVAIPFLFKDKINARIKTEINKQVNAKVDYNSFDLSLLRNFPNLSFTVNDLTIAGIDHFEGDTLAKIVQLDLGLDLMSVINGDLIDIHSIYLKHPAIHAIEEMDSASNTMVANYNIVPESEGSEEENTENSNFNIQIEDFEIEDGKISYVDFVNVAMLSLDDINLNSSAAYKNDVADIEADLQTGKIEIIDDLSSIIMEDLAFVLDGNYTGTEADVQSTIKSSSVNFIEDGTKLLSNAAVDIQWNVLSDLANSVFTFNENYLQINALKLDYEGVVGLPGDGVDIDLRFNSNSSSFKELLSLIPAKYLKDYEDLETKGTFSLAGNTKGKLTDEKTPAFNIDLNVNDGFIQYPELPTAIEDINFKANFSNTTDNVDYTTVNIQNGTLSIENEPIQLSVLAENAGADPFVDANIKGKLDLAKVKNFYPIEDTENLNGNIDADITFKGLVSEVEKEEYEKIDLNGKLYVTDLDYKSADLVAPLKVSSMHLDFSPQKATLSDFVATYGNSDFSATGSLENMVSYVFSDGDLKGNVNLNSKNLDLTEIMGEESAETETASTEEDAIVKVPKKIKVNANANFDKVQYDGIELTNVKGNINIADEKLVLNNVKANLLGGSTAINGTYSTKNEGNPKLDFAYDINKFSIEETFNYVNTVQAMAPVAKYLSGTFSSDMKFSTLINPDLSLDLTALSGLGTVKIPYATIGEMPIFEKATSLLKVANFDKPSLNNAWTVLKFEDGRVNVEPFTIKAKDMDMVIEGSNGFDESIDYTMKITVPSDKFGGAAGIANNFLSKQNIPLLNLSVPQNLTFHVGVDGQFKNPNVKILKVTANQSDKGIKDQIKDSVKEEVTNAIDQVKEDAANKAKEEADKIKQEAADKAKEEADKIKDKLKDKLKGFGW